MPDVLTPPSIKTSAPSSEAHPNPEHSRQRQPKAEPLMQVRAADLEPYIGLRYLSRLFKLMAVVLVLLLISEIVVGVTTNGIDALPTLLGEVSRLIVFAGLLWGAGDLAILVIDIGHDLRATRILMGRQLAHHTAEHHAHIDPVIAGNTAGATKLPASTSEPVPPV